MLLENEHQRFVERRPPYAIPLVPRDRSGKNGSRPAANRHLRQFVLPLIAVAAATATLLLIGISAGILLATQAAGEGVADERRETANQRHRLLRSKPEAGVTRSKLADRNQNESLADRSTVIRFPISHPPLQKDNPVTELALAGPAPQLQNGAMKKAAERSVTAPDVVPVRSETLIRAEAVCGDPFGLGRVVITFADDEMPVLERGSLLRLTERENHVRFPVTTIEFDDDGADARPVRRITTRFLFLRDKPLNINLDSLEESLLSNYQIVPDRDVGRHAALLEQWWTAYGTRVEGLTGNAHAVQQLMRRALARRLNLSLPAYPSRSFEQRPLANLEYQFERTLSTLLGIDSLLLAVPQPAGNRQLSHLETADQPLPPVLRLPPVRIAGNVPKVNVEPLAYRVPSDCFYLRCGSLANYAWLREFMTGWGGSLHEIVSMPTLHHPVRMRVERQLAMSLQRSSEMEIDSALSDMALIGYDFFFQDGAAFGVLMEARSPQFLDRILGQQRQEVLRTVTGCEAKQMQIEGLPVSLIESPDHHVRSFYVRDDRYFLVSNCERIVRNFIKTRSSMGSLGNLNEYRYVTSQMNMPRGQRAFIYLSDPFFRQLASPHYRTEVTRRANALADMYELAAARAVAESEGRPVEMVKDLIETGHLPSGFGRRADGTQPVFDERNVIDSHRGRRGTFLPIPDMRASKLTRTEVAAYHQFAQQYQRQWGRVDPLAVSIVSEPARNRSLQAVRLAVYIAPYARSRYAFLNRYLAASSTSIAKVDGEDVLALDATLRDSRGRRHQVHLGLRDRVIPFKIEKGKLTLEEHLVGGSFSRSSQYVAVTPAGSEGIQLVKRFMDDLQRGPTSSTTSASSASVTIPPLFRLLFGGSTARLLAAMFAANALETREDWTVYAPDSDVRTAVLRRIRRDSAEQAAQIRFTVVDPEQTKVANYLHAFAFAESRRASIGNEQMLNELPTQLGVPVQHAENIIHDVFAARPVCPLGGHYVIADSPTTEHWESTAWSRESSAAANHIPDHYRFPFLAWFRGMNVRFLLGQETLRADIVLRVGSDDHDLRKRMDYQLGEQSAVKESLLRPILPGDRVDVGVEGAELRVGDQVLGSLPRGTSLSVLEVRGSWIGVETERRASHLRGWVRRRDLRKL